MYIIIKSYIILLAVATISELPVQLPKPRQLPLGLSAAMFLFRVYVVVVAIAVVIVVRFAVGGRTRPATRRAPKI